MTSKRSNWQRKSASWSNKKTCGKRNCGTASVYLSLDCVLIHCPTTSAELCCWTPHYLFFRLNPRLVFCLNMSSSYLLQNFPIFFLTRLTFQHTMWESARSLLCAGPIVVVVLQSLKCDSHTSRQGSCLTVRLVLLLLAHTTDWNGMTPSLASSSPTRRKPPIRSLYHIIPISFYLPNVGQAN